MAHHPHLTQEAPPLIQWLGLEATSEDSVYKTCFHNEHIGNPMIRSLHGGVIATLIESCAELELNRHLGGIPQLQLISSSVDYLRATQDSELYCRIDLLRTARRIGFVDGICWQKNKEQPVARGTCVLRILQPEGKTV